MDGDTPTDNDILLDTVPVRRALISVHDKTGLIELGTALHAAGVALVSTGSTAAGLRAAGVPVPTGGSRRCTRSSTPASWPTAGGTPTSRRCGSWASRRSTSSWSTSTRSSRPRPPGPPTTT